MKRCLLIIFPVWADFSNNPISPEITGFWADTAIFFTQSFSREGRFKLFPYKENDCENWFQAIIHLLSHTTK